MSVKVIVIGNLFPASCTNSSTSRDSACDVTLAERRAGAYRVKQERKTAQSFGTKHTVMVTVLNPSLAVCNRADTYETGEGRFVCTLLQYEGENWDKYDLDWEFGN